jgi:hypothetical protein
MSNDINMKIAQKIPFRLTSPWSWMLACLLHEKMPAVDAASSRYVRCSQKKPSFPPTFKIRQTHWRLGASQPLLYIKKKKETNMAT